MLFECNTIVAHGCMVVRKGKGRCHEDVGLEGGEGFSSSPQDLKHRRADLEDRCARWAFFLLGAFCQPGTYSW